MEGMIAYEMTGIQQAHLRRYSIRGRADTWASGLITKLLECTHGQWLYRNIMVHDKWAGTMANSRKEHLLEAIEEQLEQEDDLLEEDKYLIEMHIGDMSQSEGTDQEYWLLAMRAARAAKDLQVAAHPQTGIG